MNRIISIKELSNILHNDNLVIIDHREKENFEKSHLPKSLLVENDDYLNPNGEYGGAVATKEQFEELMRSMGVSNSDKIVLIAKESKPVLTTKLAWILELYGHEDYVILDGNYNNLLRPGYEKESGPARKPEKSDYKVEKVKDHIIVHKEDVLDIFEGNPADGKIREGTILIDSRTPDLYEGKEESGNQREGHIPGAVNVLATSVLDENGFFKPKEEIKDLFDKKGITGGKEIITYCQGANMASMNWFALYHILGYDDVKVFDGSLRVWANDLTLPLTI